MSVLHHPDEQILTDHAIGRLKRGQGLVVEAHLAACPSCRAAVERMEAVGGAMLGGLPATEMAPDALAGVLARIDAPPEPPPARPAPPEGLPDILGGLPAGRRRWLAPGVWIRPLLSDGGSSTYLIRGGPGVRLIQHGHGGPELTCVLKGAYSDQTGRYGAGDFQSADAGLDHAPLAAPDEECICLISASGPMQMQGLLGRLIQPFVGL